VGRDSLGNMRHLGSRKDDSLHRDCKYRLMSAGYRVGSWGAIYILIIDRLFYFLRGRVSNLQ
jgi:hypothetical protein